MKALFYSLTLLLFSLSVEAGDRSQVIQVQSVSVDVVLLQTVPEPATPTEFDPSLMPVMVTVPEAVFWPAPAAPVQRHYRLTAPTLRPIRAPPLERA